MKKLITAAFVLLSLCTKAQDKPIRLGVKAGVNVSLFTSTIPPFDDANGTRYEYYTRDVRSSGMAGLTAEFLLTKGFSIGAEILYSTRGMMYSERNDYVVVVDDNGSRNARNRFVYVTDYLEVPVTINYNFFPSTARTWLAAYAGLAPAMSIHSKTKLRYAKNTDGDGYKASNENGELNDVRLINNNILFGVQAGDQKSHVYADFRGAYTLRPVFSRSSINGSNLETKMLTMTIAIGYKF
ncbi:hypothetical protein ACVWYN_002100 [Pedobacter sp. UYP24]